MRFTGIIKQEGDQFAALCLELDVASCGDSAQEAEAELISAVRAYLEVIQSEQLPELMSRPVPTAGLQEFLFDDESEPGSSVKIVPILVDHAEEFVQ